MPVCVRFIPEAFDPAWPPITPIAPAFPAAFRKSPKMANRESTFFFGTPCITTSTIFPERREAFLTSSSMLKRFAVTTSPSAPPAGVDPVQPIASTCSARRIGSSNSPCAVPRVHPRQSWYFSECTFSRPMAFIFATPRSSALLSAGDPVTREPMSSLSSVRYWNARESIIPSPAIFTSAGFVPSSSGPFGAGRLSARAVHAPPKQNPIATTVAATNRRRICSLLAPLAHTNSITHSDDAIRFLSAVARNRFPGLHHANFLRPSPPRNSTPLSSLPLPAARPTLPARPSCDFILAFICPYAHLQSLVSSPPFFFSSHKRSRLRNRQPRNPLRRLRLPSSLKIQLNSNSSKPSSDSSPTATAAKKFMPSYTSTANSAFVSSPASISTTTVPSNRSKSRSSTSPTPAAVPPTSSPAPSPTISIPPSSTPPPTRTSASNPSASSASPPATTSNTASPLPLHTIPSPPTSGSTTPSTAPASSPKKSSNSTSQLFAIPTYGSIPQRPPPLPTSQAKLLPPASRIAGREARQFLL